MLKKQGVSEINDAFVANGTIRNPQESSSLRISPGFRVLLSGKVIVQPPNWMHFIGLGQSCP